MNPPVFVVGCDRSGTSLLTVMLNQSPDLKMIFEAGFLPGLWKRVRDYGDFSESRQRWYFIRDLQLEEATSETFAFEKFEPLTEQEAEQSIRNAAPTDYQGAVDAICSALARKEGKDRWGEKMPEYVLHIEQITTIFPSAHIVHIIRDPRDVAASMCRANWYDSLRDAATYWKERVSEGKRQGEMVDDDQYHEVKYEALLQHPTEVLEGLADLLGIQFDPAMLKTHQSGTDALPQSQLEAHSGMFTALDRPIDPSRAYAWKREVSSVGAADVERVAAPLMYELGYEGSDGTVPLWLRGTRWAKTKTKAIGKKINRKIKKVGI